MDSLTWLGQLHAMPRVSGARGIVMVQGSEAELVAHSAAEAPQQVRGVDAQLLQQAGVLLGVDLVW
jgi:hypothetical protein